MAASARRARRALGRATTPILAVAVSALLPLVAACGAAQPRTLVPPPLTAVVGSQRIEAVLNGYQWSAPGMSTVADAANRPAAGLIAHEAPAGATVRLQVAGQPDALDLTEWKDGALVGETHVAGRAFTLAAAHARYTFEITAHWGSDYANYDLAVDTR